MLCAKQNGQRYQEPLELNHEAQGGTGGLSSKRGEEQQLH